MKFFIQLMVIFLLIACTDKKVQEASGSELEIKLNELAALKKQQSELIKQIDAKEEEIVKIDPSKGVKPKLITTMTLTPEGFQHYIDLQGVISSNNTSYVAPRNGMGGYVKQLYIKAGQPVRKGQLLMKLDDQVLRQSIESTKTQLSLAKNIYEKTKNLWNQNIGTEVQLLSSKTNVETLENQLKIQEEQLKTFLVYADQSGIADVVNIRVGELFSGVSVAGPQIQIVNTTDLSVNVEIPENYTGQIKNGAKVKVMIPSINKTFDTSISRISQSINASSRGFTAECKLPATGNVKPNMAAYVKILNHSNSKAIVIPVNLVQTDDKGKYVYVMNKEGNKNTASKKSITLGQIYGENIEVLGGLAQGDHIITQGYQNLYEGQYVENIQK